MLQGFLQLCFLMHSCDKRLLVLHPLLLVDEMVPLHTTSQMGFAVTREQNEVDSWRDTTWGKPTARWLAPQATHYIQTLTPNEAQALPLDLREALTTLILEWGRYDQKECEQAQGTKTSRKPTLHWKRIHASSCLRSR